MNLPLVQDCAIESVGAAPDDTGTVSIHAPGDTPSVNIYRALMEFDVSKIPQGSKVRTAELIIYVSKSSSAGELTFRRVRRSDWVAAEATWAVFKALTPWETAGGSDTTLDVSTAYSFTWTPSASTGFQTVTSSANFANLVQDALNLRSERLHLQILFTDESPTGSDQEFEFHSSSGSNPAYLFVTFTSGAGYYALEHFDLLR